MSENERTLPNGAVIDDRRTDDERQRTAFMVVATDRFMSGWGHAPGTSYFAVPVLDAGKDTMRHVRTVEANMRDRTEMMRVRVVGRDYRPRLRSGDHLSIRTPAGDDCWLISDYYREAS